MELKGRTRKLQWRLVPLVFLAVSAFASGQMGRTTGAAPQVAFEAVSIHMDDPNADDESSPKALPLAMSEFPTSLFFLRRAPLGFLVQLAYGVDSQDHIAAAPGWLDSQKYSISAKVEGDQQLTLDQIRPMLQRILRERFHFAAHPETKMISGFALVVAKGGSKLQQSRGDAQPWAMVVSDHLAGGHMRAAQIAGVLAHHTGQPVIDKTALPGLYDFQASYASTNNPDSSQADFFTALQEQLGLRLQREKVPVAFLVIDHVDRIPTEN